MKLYPVWYRQFQALTGVITLVSFSAVSFDDHLPFWHNRVDSQLASCASPRLAYLPILIIGTGFLYLLSYDLYHVIPVSWYLVLIPPYHSTAEHVQQED